MEICVQAVLKCFYTEKQIQNMLILIAHCSLSLLSLVFQHISAALFPLCWWSVMMEMIAMLYVSYVYSGQSYAAL